MSTLRGTLRVMSATPPTVEIDPSAQSVYVRFSSKAVHKTIETDDMAVVDLDRNNNVVGVELVSIKFVTIEKIVRLMKSVETPNVDWNRAKFVPAGNMNPGVACPA